MSRERRARSAKPRRRRSRPRALPVVARAATMGVLCAVGAAMPLAAQHAAAPHGAASAHSMVGAHRLTVGVGHTHVSQGRVDGDTRWLALASWALGWDYGIAPRWAVAVQSDVLLEQFVIEHGDDELLERAYPVSLVPVMLYRATPRLAVVAGAGVEYASGHTLGLTRLGAEYGVHVGDGWEVGGALVWDGKWRYYNSWGLALSVSRVVRGGRHASATSPARGAP